VVCIPQVVGGLVDLEQMKDDYDTFVSNLLEWINLKIQELNDHNFPNNLEAIRKAMTQFKEYRTVMKPPKYVLLLSLSTNQK
jgi:spectrin beta